MKLKVPLGTLDELLVAQEVEVEVRGIAAPLGKDLAEAEEDPVVLSQGRAVVRASRAIPRQR